MRFTLSFTSVCPLIKLCSIVDISLQIFRRNALLAAIMYNLFYTLGLHYWFFLFLISFPRFGLEEYTTTTHITTQETTTLFTLYGIRRACACFWKILIVFIVLSGIDLEIYFWMKWCLVKVFKTTNDVWKREVNWYYGKWTDREDGYPRINNEIIEIGKSLTFYVSLYGFLGKFTKCPRWRLRNAVRGAFYIWNGCDGKVSFVAGFRVPIGCLAIFFYYNWLA